MYSSIHEQFNYCFLNSALIIAFIIILITQLPCDPICIGLELPKATATKTGNPIALPLDVSNFPPSESPKDLTRASQSAGSPGNFSIWLPESPNTSISFVPEEPGCNSVILSMHTSEDKSICEHSPQPFTIEEFDKTGSNEVRFSFTNNLSIARVDIELMYARSDGLHQCQSLISLSPGEKYPNTLSAACSKSHGGDIEVEVSVFNKTTSHSSERKKCGDPRPKSCSYMYKIPCSNEILCAGVHQLGNNAQDDAKADQIFNHSG